MLVTPRRFGRPRIRPVPAGNVTAQLKDTGTTTAVRTSGCCSLPHAATAPADRAVVAVEKALDLYGPPVYVRKEIVHNKHVVQTLQARGAIFVDETDEVPEGETVTPAHGVAPVVHQEAAARQLKTIDATCPLVTKAHHEAAVRRHRLRHPADRSRGPRGRRDQRRGAGPRPPRRRPRRRTERDGPRTEKVVWLSQTTLSVDETMETRRLRERFPKVAGPADDDICYATQNRQAAVKKLAAEADLMIVVGSRNSSNLCAWSRSPSSTAPRQVIWRSTTPPRSTRPG